LSDPLKKRKHTEWTPEIIATLGVLTDEQVVKKFGLAVTASAVTARRHILGIPSVFTLRNKVQWKPEWVAMLGDVPDADIAAIIGVHKDTVAAKRRMIGKAKFEQRCPIRG
jgi:predicted metalloprotease with PDZ domain